MHSVLFITYDGLTDPLGQSQILPYMQGIAARGYIVTILSFEKPERYDAIKAEIQETCSASNITWHPIPFHSKYPILSKAYDRYLMKKEAIKLHKKNKYSVIHCRSYIAAEIGLFCKKKYNTKFVFDMRGFWPDEKKDGGAWNQKNPMYKYIYTFYKNKEKQYIYQSDAIVSLTNAAKKEIETWSFYKKETTIYVIPCSVDTDFFTVRKTSEKIQAKKELGVAETTFVLSYLGALGSWYMLLEMLQLFKKIKEKYTQAIFLIITHTNKSYIQYHIQQSGLKEEDFIITEARRQQVPTLLKASDINVSFIKPVYSKIASSPTKLGEVLAMGIPVITNSGVGDVKEIVEEIKGGIVLDDFDEKNLEYAVHSIEGMLQLDSQEISDKTKELLSLEKAVNIYLNLYQNI